MAAIDTAELVEVSAPGVVRDAEEAALTPGTDAEV